MRHRQRKRDERQELMQTIQQLTQRLSVLEADRDLLAHQNQLLLKVSRCRVCQSQSLCQCARIGYCAAVQPG